MKRLCVLTALIPLVLGACGRDTTTRMVILVDSDLPASVLDRVRVQSFDLETDARAGFCSTLYA